ITTCAPWRPVRPKKIDAEALDFGVTPRWMYSLIWTNRNVAPSAIVETIPARIPSWLPRLADMSVQCIVIDEDSRIAAFVAATPTGSLSTGGQGLFATTRMKK